jgi:hypothetical protein
MITTAIVVAAGSAAPEARALLAAISSSTDAPVALVPLLDAPGAVILHALPTASAPADALTLVAFCGDVVRHDGRLFFSSNPDEAPTPLTAVPIDAVRDAIRGSRQPIVVIFDCAFRDDDRFAPGRDRLVALEQSFAELAVGVLVSDARSMGMPGGIARPLADGIVTGGADLDGDGLITIDEWFAYARRRVAQLGMPPECIVSTSTAPAMSVVRLGSAAPRPVPPAAPAPPPASAPAPASPPASTSPPVSTPPTPASMDRRRAPNPARRRRLMSLIALIGAAALGLATILGAFLSGVSQSRSSPPSTFPLGLATSTSFASSGATRMAAACTRGPNRFAVAVATSASAVRPAVTALLSIDGGADARVALVRAAGTVTAPSGVSLYAASLAPFARAGSLRWSVQLDGPGTVRTVAMLCGTTVQVLAH